MGATAFGAVAVTVTADPPLPVPNLLVNPGFEAGGDRPDGWSVSSGMPELFNFVRQPGRGRTGACLHVVGRSSIMSGYLAQHVRLEPATRYVGGAWLRLQAGHCLIWLLSYVEGRRWDIYLHKSTWEGNPLVPDFIPAAFTASPPPDQWLWVGQEFATEAKQTNLNFHVGSYFERGVMDFDDAYLGLARTKLMVRVEGEALRRVRVANDKGEQCWNSGDLPAGTTTLSHELPEVSTQVRYCVTATDAAGKEVQRWYPE